MDTTTLVIIAGVVIVLVGAGAGIGFMRWKAQSKAKADEFHHFRCPGCGRKLRYRVRQVGNKGQCSHCGHNIVFPSVPRSAR